MSRRQGTQSLAMVSPPGHDDLRTVDKGGVLQMAKTPGLHVGNMKKGIMTASKAVPVQQKASSDSALAGPALPLISAKVTRSESSVGAAHSSVKRSRNVDARRTAATVNPKRKGKPVSSEISFESERDEADDAIRRLSFASPHHKSLSRGGQGGAVERREAAAGEGGGEGEGEGEREADTAAGSKRSRSRSLRSSGAKAKENNDSASQEEMVNKFGINIGDTVVVDSRTWPGVNKPGGAGRILRINDDGTFNVKYLLGGSEKGVERQYIHVQNLIGIVPERKRRSRTFYDPINNTAVVPDSAGHYGSNSATSTNTASSNSSSSSTTTAASKVGSSGTANERANSALKDEAAASSKGGVGKSQRGDAVVPLSARVPKSGSKPSDKSSKAAASGIVTKRSRKDSGSLSSSSAAAAATARKEKVLKVEKRDKKDESKRVAKRQKKGKQSDVKASKNGRSTKKLTKGKKLAEAKAAAAAVPKRKKLVKSRDLEGHAHLQKPVEAASMVAKRIQLSPMRRHLSFNGTKIAWPVLPAGLRHPIVANFSGPMTILQASRLTYVRSIASSHGAAR